MATDPKKRQKKQERRNAKRKEKKHQLMRLEPVGLSDLLTAAGRLPLLHCWIADSIATEGIGWVVLSREAPKGRVAVATFLVDSYCLGVKNVVAEVLGRSTYDSKYPRKMRTEMPSRAAPPAEAYKLLQEAAAYARDLGFPPHPDYRRATLLFGDVDPATSDAAFTFGKDGKPFYVAGPYDSLRRSRQIVDTLEKRCGSGGFDYLVAVSGQQGIGLQGEPDGGVAGEGIQYLEEGEEEEGQGTR